MLSLHFSALLVKMSSSESFQQKLEQYRRLDSLGDESDADEAALEADRKRKKEFCRFFPQPNIEPHSHPLEARLGNAVPLSAAAEVIDLTKSQDSVIEVTPQATTKFDLVQPKNIHNHCLRLHRVFSPPHLPCSTFKQPAVAVEDILKLDPSKPARHCCSQGGVVRTDSIAVSPSEPTGSPMTRKRKREGDWALAPESERIFNNQRFYYVPDNDIHPARKVRISKARQHGANWVHEASKATHIIVDKNLEYHDITGIIADKQETAIVVTEDYPIDCLRYKRLLNATQKMYQIKGYPKSNLGLSSTRPYLAHEIMREEPKMIESSQESLQLQTASYNQRSTIGHDSLRSPQRLHHLNITNHATVRTKEITLPTTTGNKTTSSSVHPCSSSPIMLQSPSKLVSLHTDELSDYISLMQKYKDLPFDHEEDRDDINSTRPGMISNMELEDSGSEGECTLKYKHVLQSLKDGKSKSRIPKKRKEISWEDRFACNHGGTLNKQYSENPNSRTIEMLQLLCDYYTRTSDHWRITAYRKAISTLWRQKELVCTAEEAYQLPNIGQRLAEKIEEIVTTDRLKKLEALSKEPQDQSLQLFLGIYGVGINIAQAWVSRGFRTLDDLLAKAKLNANQRIGIERYNDLNTRIPRREVGVFVNYVRLIGKAIDENVDIVVSGSYRRGALSSKDVDFIITRKGTSSSGELIPFLEALLKRLEDEKIAVCTFASLHSRSRDGPGSKWQGCCILPESVASTMDPPPTQSEIPLPPKSASSYNPIWRRVDFLLVPESEMGAALLYFTGNDLFNRSMRLLASKKGLRLNQRGLYREVSKESVWIGAAEKFLVEGRDERKIFEALGVKWREPEERWC